MNLASSIDTPLLEKFVVGRPKAIFPWSLSIVDCYFLHRAFAEVGGAAGNVLVDRISAAGLQVDPIKLDDAYDIYRLDSEAAGAEVVITHRSSGSSCYWDVHERFVVVCGSSDFVSMVRPFPEHIEKHRYVEAMLFLEDEGKTGVLVGEIYDFLNRA